ncbi:hypothetical protein XaC1_553 [Xanthomonas phage XaC1]|nr:hypothetical protein XaC1_553 [Xanthomonas phage XaC1]
MIGLKEAVLKHRVSELISDVSERNIDYKNDNFFNFKECYIIGTNVHYKQGSLAGLCKLHYVKGNKLFRIFFNDRVLGTISIMRNRMVMTKDHTSITVELDFASLLDKEYIFNETIRLSGTPLISEMDIPELFSDINWIYENFGVLNVPGSGE